MASYELHDVFISYRRYEDAAGTNPQGLMLAQTIYQFLTKKGLKVFWDRPEMQAGDFAAQLDWQLEHSPNYIFLATENAKRFRQGEKDYVEHELKTALKLYDDSPDDRVVLPVFPMAAVNKVSAEACPPEIQRLFSLHGVNLAGVVPSGEELEEILRHITRIHRGNVWNAGYRWLQQAKEHRFSGLVINDTLISRTGIQGAVRFPIRVSDDDESGMPLMEMIGSTNDNFYLIGSGGIGKTTALLRIMEEAYDDTKSKKLEKNRLNGQVPLFIELSRAPDVVPRDRGREWQVYSAGKSTFIHREIYRQIRRDLRLRQIHEDSLEQIDEIYSVDYEVAVRPVVNLMSDAKPAPEYLLLLDGLNEISRREIKMYNAHGELEFSRSVVSMVLDEIREIMKYKNVRVILTSRSKEAASLAENTVLLNLDGVNPETIEEYLTQKQVPQPRINAALDGARLRDVLRTPLFLIMYAELGGEDELLTAGEIMRLFFHQDKKGLYTQTARTDTVHSDVKDSSEGAEPSSRVTPEMIRFILDFILPEVAWKMVLAGSFHIRCDRLADEEEGLDGIIESVLTDNSDESVCGRFGRYAFPEYESEDFEDAAGLASVMTERFGGMKNAIRTIRYCMVHTLGILYEADHEYSFIHHHIRDYFSAVHHINRLKMAAYLHDQKNDDVARACLNEWKDHPLPATTRRFIGEALGEAHNAPVCDEKGIWRSPVPKAPCERNLIRRAFDVYRGRFAKQEGHGLWSRIGLVIDRKKVKQDRQDGYCVWNLLEILKAVREDLSGENFSSLDLTLCEINGHSLGRKGLAAALDNARLNEQFFMPRGHKSWVHSAVYSPDGSRILTASADDTAKIWDAETLQEIGTIKTCGGVAVYSPDGCKIMTTARKINRVAMIWDAYTLREIGALHGQRQRGQIYNAVFSPDGSRIVIAFEDGTVKVWSLKTLREIGTLSDSNYLHHPVAFSPDGRTILTTSGDSTVKLWDAETLQETGKQYECGAKVWSVAYSPDGHRITIASYDNLVRILDAENLQEIGMLSGHIDKVYSAVYSPDGQRIITASADHTVKIWDVETFQEIGTLHVNTSEVESAVYSPDGSRILTRFGDASPKVWDAETMQEIGTLRGSMVYVSTVMYSPDGRKLLTAANDDTVTIWNAETMRAAGALPGHVGTSDAISPDGRRILTIGQDHTVKIWDVDTMQDTGILHRYSGTVNTATFSPDGQRIMTVSLDSMPKIWDAKTLREIWTLKRSDYDYDFSELHLELEPDADGIQFAKYCSGGSMIVTVSNDGTLEFWDAKDLYKDMSRTLRRYEYRTRSIMFSPDGRRFMIVTDKNMVEIWDTLENVKIGVLEEKESCSESPHALFSPNGQIIVTYVSHGHIFNIWNAQTLKKTGTLEADRRFSFIFVMFSPDGRRIVGADYRDVKIWDVMTLQEVGVLQGFTKSLNAVTYSPDGSRIVTATEDGEIKIWNAETFECIQTVHFIPGLQLTGVDIRHLHPDSRLTDETRTLLYEYGAIVDDRG